MNNADVVIVVLSHNKKNDVLECLDSIYYQDYKNFEVVLVDNASADNTIEAVSSGFPSVHLIKNKINLGSSAGRNIGWRYAEENFDYKYLLFLDDDAVIRQNFISKLTELLNDNTEIGIACGKAFTNNNLDTIMSAGISTNLFSGAIYDIGAGTKDNGQYDTSGYTDACGSFAIMIRRELFAQLGGFDNNYYPYGFEDVDLCLRAKKLGYYTYYLSEAIVIHKGTKLGRKPNPVYEKSKMKNYLYLLLSNTNSIQKLTCVVCLPFRTLKLSLKLVYNGDAAIILAHLKGLFIAINNIKATIKNQTNNI